MEQRIASLLRTEEGVGPAFVLYAEWGSPSPHLLAMEQNLLLRRELLRALRAGSVGQVSQGLTTPIYSGC